MITKEELFLGLAVAGLFLGSISYIALSDALKNFRLRIIQSIFTLRKGSTPRRRKGLRIVK